MFLHYIRWLDSCQILLFVCFFFHCALQVLIPSRAPAKLQSLSYVNQESANYGPQAKYGLPAFFFFISDELKISITFLNGRKKSKQDCFMMWKLYTLQILVSINQVLLETALPTIYILTAAAFMLNSRVEWMQQSL